MNYIAKNATAVFNNRHVQTSVCIPNFFAFIFIHQTLNSVFPASYVVDVILVYKIITEELLCVYCFIVTAIVLSMAGRTILTLISKYLIITPRRSIEYELWIESCTLTHSPGQPDLRRAYIKHYVLICMVFMYKDVKCIWKCGQIVISNNFLFQVGFPCRAPSVARSRATIVVHAFRHSALSAQLRAWSALQVGALIGH